MTKKLVPVWFSNAGALVLWWFICFSWTLALLAGVLNTVSGNPVTAIAWGVWAGLQVYISPRWSELWEQS